MADFPTFCILRQAGTHTKINKKDRYHPVHVHVGVCMDIHNRDSVGGIKLAHVAHKPLVNPVCTFFPTITLQNQYSGDNNYEQINKQVLSDLAIMTMTAMVIRRRQQCTGTSLPLNLSCLPTCISCFNNLKCLS